jgi:hypothetical protein
VTARLYGFVLKIQAIRKRPLCSKTPVFRPEEDSNDVDAHLVEAAGEIRSPPPTRCIVQLQAASWLIYLALVPHEDLRRLLLTVACSRRIPEFSSLLWCLSRRHSFSSCARLLVPFRRDVP